MTLTNACAKGSFRQSLGGIFVLPFLLLGVSSACSQSVDTAAEAAHAQSSSRFHSWHFSAEISPNYEYYDVFGTTSQSPYPHLDGHWFTDYNWSFSGDVSPYEHVRATMFGVLNYSDYRNQELDDLIIERGNIEWQKGDAAIPFRVEAGDFFSFYSLRTVQRSLKGVQLDLQPDIPQLSKAGWQNSFQTFWGAPEPLYREIDLDDEMYAGVSWLMAHPVFGEYAVNAVHNFKAGDKALKTRDTTETVVSAGFEKKFEIAGRRLNLEGEYAHYDGKPSQTGTARGDDLKDNAFFLELRTQGWVPELNFGFLFEQYGDEYQPRGASVSADRRTYEARANYRFKDGVRLRGRLQRYEDGWESLNPLITHTAGIDMNGPFTFGLLPKNFLTGSINNYVSELKNDDITTHSLTYSTNGYFRKELGEQINASLGASYVYTRDKVRRSGIENKQLTLGLDYSFKFGEISVVAAPRMVVRHAASTSNRVYEYGPSLNIDIAGGGHALSLDYSFLNQDGYEVSPNDTHVHAVAARYNYTYENHRIGLEGTWRSRAYDPLFEADTQTDSLKLAARYTLLFERSYSDETETSAPQSYAPIEETSGDARFIDIPPGTSLEVALKRLARAGIAQPVRRSNAYVFDVTWLDNIDQRQKFVLETRSGRVERAVLFIALDDVGDRRTAEQSFQRVRAAFARRYGQPITYDQGNFAGDFRNAVNTDQLIRIAQWRLPKGHLRVGIPNRLDRSVQIEVHYARRFPDLQQTGWALDNVR